MTKVTLTLEAVIEDDGNIYLTNSAFAGSLIYYVEEGDDPEKELCMLGVNTMSTTDFLVETETPVDESSVAQVIAKSNQLMAEVKRLRSKLM